MGPDSTTGPIFVRLGQMSFRHMQYIGQTHVVHRAHGDSHRTRNSQDP